MSVEVGDTHKIRNELLGEIKSGKAITPERAKTVCHMGVQAACDYLRMGDHPTSQPGCLKAMVQGEVNPLAKQITVLREKMKVKQGDRDYCTGPNGEFVPIRSLR